MYRCLFTRLSGFVRPKPICSLSGTDVSQLGQQKTIFPFISDTLLGDAQCLDFAFSSVVPELMCLGRFSNDSLVFLLDSVPGVLLAVI